MKLHITFKTPDAVDYAVDEHGQEFKEEIKKTTNKFVRYGELVTIEFDTETQTATVLPVR
jgi:hypothetical protein